MASMSGLRPGPFTPAFDTWINCSADTTWIARVHAHHDAAAADREVIEPRAARRGGDGGVRNTQVSLQKRRQPSALIDTAADADRQPEQDRILRALGHVRQALYRADDDSVPHTIGHPLAECVELLVRDVVVPRFERRRSHPLRNAIDPGRTRRRPPQIPGRARASQG